MAQDTVRFNFAQPDSTDTVSFNFKPTTDTVKFNLRAPRVLEEQEQVRAPIKFSQALIEGFGSGGMFIEPEVSFGDLSAPLKTARVIGNVAGMFTVHGVLNALTGGSATVAAVSMKSAKTIQKAGQAWQKGQKAEAIAQIGLGNTHTFYNSRVATSKFADDFFNTAAKNPDAALKILRGQRVRKEAAIFTAYGQIGTTAEQLQSDEQFDVMKNIKSLPFDAAGGALYARGAYKKAVENANLFSAKRFTVGSTEKIAAGMLSTGLNSSEATLTERLASGVFVAAFGGLSGGAEITSTVNNVSRALRSYVPEINEKGVADAIANYSVQKAAKELSRIPKAFEGLDFKSKTGFTAKGFQVTKNDKGVLKIRYDVYAPNTKEPRNKGVETTLDKFLETYKSTPRNVNRIIRNVLEDGSTKVFFNTDKDIKKFWEQGKWGIITADRAPNKTQLKILPGETRDEALVRDIVARGYDEKDIVRVQKSGSKGYENSFIVKNLKETDAIQLGKLTGQEQITTHKGIYELVRSNKKKPMELSEVILHSKIAGSTVTGKTVEQGKKIIGRRARVSGGGSVLIPKRGGQGVIQRNQGTGNQVYVPNTPNKFIGDVYVVELLNGRKVAVGNEIAFGKVTRKTKTSKSILGESDLQKVRGQSKKVGKKEKHLGIHNELRQIESQLGLRDGRGRGLHRNLKDILFNTRRTNRLTKEQSKTYKGILTNQSQGGATGVKIIDDFLKNDLTFVQYAAAKGGLSIHRTYEFLYEKTGAPVFRKIAQRLLDKGADSEIIKGKFYTMRRAQDDFRKTNSLSTKEFNSIMYGLIMPKRFGHLLEGYDKAYLEKYSEIVALHKKLMDEIYIDARSANVKEGVFINGKLTRIDIRKEKDFMPLVVSDELLEFVNKNDNVFEKVFEQLRLKNPGASDSELLALYKRFANNTEKNGIYGVQYSRVFDLDPVYFLDENGGVIRTLSKSDFNLKEGQVLNGKKIAKRIEAYSVDYTDSMDRYGGRISNIISLSKHFGDGIYKYGNIRTVKGSKVYSDDINELFNEIKLQTKGRGKEVDSEELISLFQNDLDRIIRTESRSFGSRTANNVTGYAATFGLSGFLSPVKNAMLGTVQSIGTLGIVDFSKAFANMVFNKNFRKTYMADYRAIGGEASGMKFLDTTFNLEGASSWRKLLVSGMTATEKVNRVLAVATGDYAANRALKTLNSNASASKKTEAARLLRDTLGLGDDYVNAVNNKTFSTEQRNRMLVRAHGTTQGISDPIFLPRMFTDSELIKPLTLFTRIATIVTDNVYANMVKPAREGNIQPILRYAVGAGLGGAAYTQIVHAAYQTEPDKWETIPERLWSYMDYGELLGVFSIANDIIQGVTRTDVALGEQFAVSRFLSNIAQASVYIANGVMSMDELDDYFANTDDIKYDTSAERREALTNFAGLTALTSQADRVVKGWTKTDELKGYESFIKDQREFLVLTGGAQEQNAAAYIPSSVEGYRANLHYQYLRNAFYGGSDKEQFSRAYRAAVNAKAMQLQAKNRNTMTSIKAFRQAEQEVNEYLKQLDPTKLSKERNGRKFSRYDDWYGRTFRKNPERLKQFNDLNKFFRQRRRELIPYSKRELRAKDYPNYVKEMQYRGNN